MLAKRRWNSTEHTDCNHAYMQHGASSSNADTFYITLNPSAALTHSTALHLHILFVAPELASTAASCLLMCVCQHHVDSHVTRCTSLFIQPLFQCSTPHSSACLPVLLCSDANPQARVGISVTSSVFEFLLLLKAAAVAVKAPEQAMPQPVVPGEKPFVGLAYM